jgi:GNAT superfamily N-acetyltransferase
MYKENIFSATEMSHILTGVAAMPHRATVKDITVLVDHHIKMFQEILFLSEKPIIASAFQEMELNYHDKLVRQLNDGTCAAWVIEHDHRIVASAAVTLFDEWIPSPQFPDCHYAYVHSVYTEKTFRNKGYALELAQTAVDYCKSRNTFKIDLVASDAGKRIYERCGFKPLNNVMRYLPEADIPAS